MIGQIIGSYKIVQKIGEGGMGTVYLGRDLMLNREVAIKVLRPEMANQPELVSRFRTEAMTMARLNHPNIATLYSFLHEGDLLFMAMEFVRGRTLEEVLRRRGPLKLVEGLRLFCQVLEGVAYANSLGVVHRDLKPENIMLTDAEEVKIMDFGIARVLGTARQTKGGRLYGTLEYISPEQMRAKETDARSDIYSLGILLFEMLTGHVPFESESDYELIRAQVEAMPPSPTSFKGNIPLPVERAILRALAKDPDSRFQSAIEFRDALVCAVPEAALASQTRKFVLRTTVKTRRQKANLTKLNFGLEQMLGRAKIAGDYISMRISAARQMMPSVSLKQGIRGFLSRLHSKHYVGAAGGLVLLLAGMFLLQGGNEKRVPAKLDLVVNSTPAPVVEQPEPAPTVETPDNEPQITPDKMRSSRTKRSKRAFAPRIRPEQEQFAFNNTTKPILPRFDPMQPRSSPTPQPLTARPETIQPRPSPTPQPVVVRSEPAKSRPSAAPQPIPEKKDKWYKRVAKGTLDRIKNVVSPKANTEKGDM